MSIRIALTPHYSYTSSSYSFSVLYGKKASNIHMNIHNGIYTTEALPQTVPLLQRYLPGIFTTDCFNNENLSFRKEVENTEIAHLFEHILLEYLCSCLLTTGKEKIVVNGVTTWNWHQEPIGTYHINIDSGIQEKELFSQALKQSINLFNKILYPFQEIN